MSTWNSHPGRLSTSGNEKATAKRAALPLIPHSVQDARDLYAMIRSELACHVEDGAAEQLALECIRHLRSVGRMRSDGLRPVCPLVLYGPNGHDLLIAARSIVDLMAGLPAREVPLTMVSEQGWTGRSLAEWLEPLSNSGDPFASRAVVVLTGLQCLCMRRGTYSIANGSGSTQDYRLGKSQNLTTLLTGQFLPAVGADWSARDALVIITALYDGSDHCAAALDDWGLLPELASLLAGATWVRVGTAEARRADVVIQHLQATSEIFAAMGYALNVSPEAVLWALQRAQEQGESGEVAATWIAESLRRRLIHLLASGDHGKEIVLGPDDVAAPAAPPGIWHD